MKDGHRELEENSSTERSMSVEMQPTKKNEVGYMETGDLSPELG